MKKITPKNKNLRNVWVKKVEKNLFFYNSLHNEELLALNNFIKKEVDELSEQKVNKHKHRLLKYVNRRKKLLEKYIKNFNEPVDIHRLDELKLVEERI